ncbi:MAG: twin-arginine translocation signal domain-containing protein [bacterium]|nr:twin-arginine translocation signal domain-containing protein [bacterium]
MKTKQHAPPKKDPIGRRGFLKLAGLGTTVGVASALGGVASASELPNDKAKGSGYRETDHVKRYYELAKF